MTLNELRRQKLETENQDCCQQAEHVKLLCDSKERTSDSSGYPAQKGTRP